jgi:hypothetical protein
MHPLLMDGAMDGAMDGDVPVEVAADKADLSSLFTPQVRAEMQKGVSAALQNTDLAFNLCRKTDTDLCPVVASLCSDRDGSEYCAALGKLCGKGGMRLRTTTCIVADGPMCAAATRVCKGKTTGVCGVLSNLCAAQ